MKLASEYLHFNGRDIGQFPLTEGEIKQLRISSRQAMKTERAFRLLTFCFVIMPALAYISYLGSWSDLLLGMGLAAAVYTGLVYCGGWLLKKRIFEQLGCSQDYYDPFNQTLFRPLHNNLWLETCSQEAKQYMSRVTQSGRKPLMLDRYIALKISDRESCAL